MIPRERKRLGDLLVEANVITREQLQKALEIQRSSGKRLGTVLIENNIATEEQIITTLEFQLGIPRLYLHRLTPDKALLEKTPESLVRRHKVFPVGVQGAKVLVAMSDPLNLVAIQDLELALGLEVEAGIATEREIELAIQRYYGLPEELKSAYESSKTETVSFFNIDQGSTSTDDAPVIKAVNTILQTAVKEGASDIHIEPREHDLRVRLRVDGVLREAMTLSKNIHPPMISRLKIMAEMDIAEKRLPQDGRIMIKYGTRNIDLRVSSLPSIFGEKIVIRLLDKENQFLSLEQLGFRPKLLEKFKNVLASPYGMILLTGPTGSGKTTTLYASLGEINQVGRNIVTIEDPVEYILPGIIQVQTNVKAGLDFASGLRSILRQDPDVIMVGEIRDKETASIAVRAATTGHLVFSTLHTNDAAGAVTRLVDMEVEPFLVASSVVGIVAQRLVRRNCPYCREEYDVPPGTQERLFLKIPDEQPLRLKRGRGCAQCGFTGYKGRLALHELLVVNAGIQELILRKTSAEKIKELAMAQGMEDLYMDGVEKILQGATTVQEVLRVAYWEEGR
ncbi:type II secretion system protein GspE [Thermanaerosceptrum fracticalcis]|uniref:Type II secretion system protein GspE n=1 Tax=Thermanaerosceptrum fracticalcis TaxID=1712410 RepID=A0A7G6E0A3_THEFR|nr:ATPase, T2SS/T4P/T4SS family [Thermanaerosceptrum fracticalcis]QNB45507.1 type II secretion system protein GspE [Thermanaerosceptrum fracticalcis]